MPQDNTDDQPNEDFLVFEQSSDTSFEIAVRAADGGELWRFKNAKLAYAETNKNDDDISRDNIQELAATLAGRAVDIDHNERSNAGVITSSRPVVVGGRDAVAIDGLLWRDRYPQEIDGVKAGTHHLSVEANADMATCSICKGQFKSSDVYCSHLKNRKQSGAKRGFIGLKGKGAGITRNPAGNGTHFDREQIFVVAHMEDNSVEAHWYDGLLKDGESIDDLPASDFADPKNRRFPYKVHGKVNERGWHAAWSAANGGHTGQKDESAIEKLKRDKPEGVTISESQEINAMEHKCPHCGNDDQQDHEKCPKCGKSMSAALLAAELRASQEALKTKKEELEAAVAELEDLKPQIPQLQAQMAGYQTQITEREVALKAANAKLEDIKRQERENIVRAYLSDDTLADRLPAYMAMDDGTFTTVVATLKDAAAAAKKPAQGISGLRSGMPEPVAGSGSNGQRAKPQITLR